MYKGPDPAGKMEIPVKVLTRAAKTEIPAETDDNSEPD